MNFKKNQLVLIALFLAFTQVTLAQKKGKKNKGNESIEYTWTFNGINKKDIGGPIKSGPEFSTSKAKAFIFNTASTEGGYSIPKNSYGSEISSTQNENEVYGGIVAYASGKDGDNLRSYICFNMQDKWEMRKNLKYCVSYEVSLAETSKFAINGLGILFSKDAYSGEIPLKDGSEPELVLNPTNGKDTRDVIKGFAGWEKVGYVYTATGKEKYLSIGNFIINGQYGAPEGIWKVENVKTPKDAKFKQKNHAFYYVDNVNIKLITNDEECDCFLPRKKNLEAMFSTISYNKLIRLDDLETDKQRIEAYSIHFSGGKNSFSSNAVKYMDNVIKMMQNNPSFKLQVIGHCDIKEIEAGEQDEQYKNLDMQRADGVIRYFVKKGISTDRLKGIYKSDQEMSPDAVENDDDDIKEAKNRRVEFRVE